MGSGPSSETAVFALDPFVGEVPLRDDDVLFEEMLTARIGAKHVSVTDEVLENLCAQLEANDRQTHNFQKLLRVVLRKAREVHALPASAHTDDSASAAANTLFVSRIFLRYLIQSATAVEGLRDAHMQLPGEVVDDEDGGLMGELFRVCVDLLVDLPHGQHTASLLTEACLLCQTLLCVQMFCPLSETPVALLASTLCSAHRADRLAHALIRHHIYSPAPAPAGEDAGISATADTGANGGGKARQWGLLPAVLYLPRTLFSLLFTTGGPSTPPPTLHSASLCLLLVLAQDLPRELQLVAGGARTLVAESMALLEDDMAAHTAGTSSTRFGGGGNGGGDGGGGDGDDLELHGGGFSPESFALAISFPSLFDALCAQLPLEAEVLLLYHLLHTNTRFLRYVLSRADVDLLLLPLLRGVYETAAAKAPPPARMYMLLIVLLILSQDRAIMDVAFSTSVARVPWFRERILAPISIGSLAVCALCRLVNANLNTSARRDPYVSTNCLASLANMAPSLKELHPHAAQSLVSLYGRLRKRHAKLGTRVALALHEPLGRAGGTTVVAALAEVRAEQDSALELASTLLETINAALSDGLSRNVQLVYAVLERQELFALPHPAEIADVLANISVVISFFAPRVAAVGSSLPSGALPTTAPEAAASDAAAHHHSRTAQEAMTALEAAAADWTPSLLSPMPELRFSYEQEPDAEEFFTPYLWALVAEVMSLVDTSRCEQEEPGEIYEA